MKRRSRFKKDVEYLCTRRRVLSFTVALLSAVTALLYIIYAGVCVFNIDKVKDMMKGLWGFKYIANVGLYTLFSVLGIILFTALGLYRCLMCYFYYKIYKCNVDFYKERRKDIYLFSAFSFVMAFVFFFLYSKEGFEMPYVGNVGPAVMGVIYLFLGVIPFAEKIVCDAVVAKMRKEYSENVPKMDDITEELETDADNSVIAAVGRAKNDEYSNAEKPEAIEAMQTEGSAKTKNGAAYKTKNETADNAKKEAPRGKEDIFDTAEEERITKNYGKAAGRLARKLKEMEEDDED